MLVIHPKDKTTTVLSLLYKNVEHTEVMDQSCTNAEIKHRLNHMNPAERIMLLGHGSDQGLFSRTHEEQDGFDRLIISHAHAFYLRRHRGSIVGIWCNADKFARAHSLHGLFSGMIVSEMSEAQLYDIPTTQEELDTEIPKLFARIRQLLDMALPLSEIPRRIQEMDDVHSPLTEFNYKRFYYL